MLKRDIKRIVSKVQSDINAENVDAFLKKAISIAESHDSEKKSSKKKDMTDCLMCLGNIAKENPDEVSKHFNHLSTFLTESMKWDQETVQITWNTFLRVFRAFTSDYLIRPIDRWKDFTAAAFNDNHETYENAMKQLDSLFAEMKNEERPKQKEWWALILNCICHCYQKNKCKDKEFFTEFHMKVFDALKKDITNVTCSTRTDKAFAWRVYQGVKLLDKCQDSKQFVDNVLWFYDKLFPMKLLAMKGVTGDHAIEELRMFSRRDESGLLNPTNLAYFDGVLEADSRRILEQVGQELGPSNFGDIVSCIKPGLEILGALHKRLRSKAEPEGTDVMRMFSHLIRIRGILLFLFDIANQFSFPLMGFVSWRFLNLDHPVHPFVLSLYFAIIHDKHTSAQEIKGFFQNIMGLVKEFNPDMVPGMLQLFVKLTSHITASASASLLGLNPEDEPTLQENPVIALEQMVPKSREWRLDGIDGSVVRKIGFCYRLHCGRWVHDGPKMAEELIWSLLEGDKCVSYLITGSVVNTLVNIYKATGEVGSLSLLIKKLIPRLMNILYGRDCEHSLLHVGLSVMVLARRKGFLNERMALDWAAILSKWLLAADESSSRTLWCVTANSCLKGLPHEKVILKRLFEFGKTFPMNARIASLALSVYVCGIDCQLSRSSENTMTMMQMAAGLINISKEEKNMSPQTKKAVESFMLFVFLSEILIRRSVTQFVGVAVQKLLKTSPDRSLFFWSLVLAGTHYFDAITASIEGFFGHLVSAIDRALSAPKCSSMKFYILCDILCRILVESKKGAICARCFEVLEKVRKSDNYRGIFNNHIARVLSVFKNRNEIVQFDDTWEGWTAKQDIYRILLRGTVDHAEVGVTNRWTSNIYTISALPEPEANTSQLKPNKQHLLFDVFVDGEEGQEVAEEGKLSLAKWPRRRNISLLSVLYMKDVSMKCSQMLSVDWNETSQEFREFLFSLGSPVSGGDYTSVKFKKSHLLEKDNDTFFYRYDEKDVTVSVAIPLVSGSQYEDKESKRQKLISSSNAVVVWMPSGGTIDLNEWAEMNISLVITIEPVWEGGLKVTVKNRKKWLLGLACKSLIVSKEVVPLTLEWLFTNFNCTRAKLAQQEKAGSRQCSVSSSCEALDAV